MEMPFTGKEKIKQNFEWFILMLLKFEIIWTWIGQVIRFWNNIDFSETPCIYKWYVLLDSLYIDKKFDHTPSHLAYTYFHCFME